MCASGAALAFSAYAQQGPSILIVQPKHREKGSLPPGVQVATLVASELDQMGQVLPITWATTDPIFRQAIASGKVSLSESGPSIGDAQAAERAMHASYLLVLDTELDGSLIRSKARLFEGSRLVWQDPTVTQTGQIDVARRLLKKRAITKEDFDRIVASSDKRISNVSLDDAFDVDNTARSLARTWAELLANGPFKGLALHPHIVTPEPAKGDAPKVAAPDSPIVPKVVDNAELMKTFREMLGAGQFPASVNLMHEAVDSAPLDPDRRAALIEALVKAGQSELAASEARRAAILLPDKPELHLAAARAYLASGKPDAAQDELNQAIAHGANMPGIHPILAEMDLGLLKYSDAVSEYDLAVKAEPNAPELLFARGLAKSLSGDSAGAGSDFDAATKLGLKSDDPSVRTRYVSTVASVGASIADSGKKLAALIAQAKLDRKSASAKTSVSEQAAIGAARLAFFKDLAHPAIFDGSHQRRSLALNLLNQCVAQVQDYIGSGSEDTLVEARINLGEALKQADAAAAAMKQELAKEAADKHGNDGGGTQC